MNFKQLYQRITNSQAFEKFKSEHPNSELVIGYFVIDYESEINQEQLDYKTNGKIFSFSLTIDDEISVKQEELIEAEGRQPLEKIDNNINIKTENYKDKEP